MEDGAGRSRVVGQRNIFGACLGEARWAFNALRLENGARVEGHNGQKRVVMIDNWFGGGDGRLVLERRFAIREELNAACCVFGNKGESFPFPLEVGVKIGTPPVLSSESESES